MNRPASAPPPSSSSSFFLNKFLPFASKQNHHHHHDGSSAILDNTTHSGAPSVCATSDGGFASSSAAEKQLPSAPASSPKMIKSHMEDNNSMSSDDEQNHHKRHNSPVSSFRRRASRHLFRRRRRHQHHQPSSSRSIAVTISSSPHSFHDGSAMDQEVDEVENHHDHHVTLPNEENSFPNDEPSSFYRMDDRFARCLNECDPVMLPELRRKRQDRPIVISEQEDYDDELTNDGWLMQSFQVETNAMLKAILHTTCTNRRIVILGPKASATTPTTEESLPFVVQHIGRYQHQPYYFSCPSE